MVMGSAACVMAYETKMRRSNVWYGCQYSCISRWNNRLQKKETAATSSQRGPSATLHQLTSRTQWRGYHLMLADDQPGSDQVVVWMLF